jgi:Tol biopolymer transport system component
VNADGTGNHLLLASPGLDYPAGWSREDRILFTRSFHQSQRRGSIFAVDADGSGLHRVGRGFAAAWSPDGSKILYSLSVPGPLYIMNADGSHKRLVVNVVAWQPDWR